MAENTPVPSETPPQRTRQNFNDVSYSHGVPGTSMANIYRDLAVRFINNPQSTVEHHRNPYGVEHGPFQSDD